MGEEIGFLDLSAEIVPGLSAAGFSLGLTLDEVLLKIKSYKIKIEGEQLMLAVRNNQSWLKFDLQSKPGAPVSYSTLFYKNIVSLHFENLILEMIVLNDGYLGTYNSSIHVGSSGDEVRALGELTYDGNEEVYFYSDWELGGVEYTFERDKVNSIIICRPSEIRRSSFQGC